MGRDGVVVRWKDDGSFGAASYFIAAFKFDIPPAIIEGEFLRNEDGDLRGFDGEVVAAEAAFKEERERIDIYRG